MKRLLLVFLGILIVAGLAGCNIHTNKDGSQERNYQQDIDAIYYGHWAVMCASDDAPAYKIDLLNSSFYEITSGTEYNRDDWGTLDGDADFVFVSALQDDAIDSYFRETARHGFTLWEPSYQDTTILDGSTWYIKIVFSDQSIMESSGLNKYPETWAHVMQDFKDLTGETFHSFS